MFVQFIEMKTPQGKIRDLRQLIAQEYLPAIQKRDGFLHAHLLEQVDDRDNAKLIIYWESFANLENSITTGILAGSQHSIAARLPGLRVIRQSYIVDVSTVQDTVPA